MTDPMRLSRRGFLGATMAAAAGVAVTGPEALAGSTKGYKTSPLVVHDWSYYQKDFTGFKAYFQKYGVPKYITFNTDQAELARAASGAITFDLTHPCIAYS
jgi:spermidine/putrescine-binding protein